MTFESAIDYRCQPPKKEKFPHFVTTLKIIVIRMLSMIIMLESPPTKLQTIFDPEEVRHRRGAAQVISL